MSSDLPGWTCPGIDRLAETIRRHVPEPERTDSLIRLEALRVSHVQLRAAASRQDPARTAAEVARLEARIARLERLEEIGPDDIDTAEEPA
jgi:hypothetical protein